MIEPKDPYWRRILGAALGVVLVATMIAAAAFPGSESHDGEASPGEGTPGMPAPSTALEVTALDYLVYPNHEPAGSHLMTWVNVTNPGEEPATGITAEMRGAQLAFVTQAAVASWTGNVGRGGSSAQTFHVVPRTTATVQAQIASTSFLGSIGLQVTSPAGKTYAGTSSGRQATLSLPAPEITAGTFGDWTATVSSTGGLRGFSFQVTVDFEYDAPAQVANLTLDELPPGETIQFYYNIWADEPYTTVPPGLMITVNATVQADAGQQRVSFVAQFEKPVVEGPTAESHEEGGPLTPGEFLGFAAVGIISLSVASGAMRVRGGRTRSQDRNRMEVTLHRVAWVSVIGVLVIHGLVQLTSGHAPAGAVVLGTLGFATLGGIVWFNAYQRKRVQAMEWRRWLAVKVAAVAFALLFVALHLALYGRHF